MTQRNQDFSLYVGESQTVSIAITNPDGTPFDPTLSTLQWWAAPNWYDTGVDVLIKKSLNQGITAGTGGVVDIELDASDTANLVAGYYYHELKIFLPDGGVSTACTGTMVVRPAFHMGS